MINLVTFKRNCPKFYHVLKLIYFVQKFPFLLSKIIGKHISENRMV